MINKKACKYFITYLGKSIWTTIKYVVGTVVFAFNFFLAVKFLKWFMIPITLFLIYAFNAYIQTQLKLKSNNVKEDFSKLMKIYDEIMDLWYSYRDTITFQEYQKYRELYHKYEMERCNFYKKHRYYLGTTPDVPWRNFKIEN